MKNSDAYTACIVRRTIHPRTECMGAELLSEHRAMFFEPPPAFITPEQDLKLRLNVPRTTVARKAPRTTQYSMGANLRKKA